MLLTSRQFADLSVGGLLDCCGKQFITMLGIGSNKSTVYEVHIAKYYRTTAIYNVCVFKGDIL